MSNLEKENNNKSNKNQENDKDDLDSDSSQLSNFEEKIKNDDIISSSSDEENNNEKEVPKELKSKEKEKEKDFKSQEIKLLGNKRSLAKENKDNNKMHINKYKSYNNFDNNKKYQPSLDVPLVTYELFCELVKEKDFKKNSNLTDNDYKILYEEYKVNHEKKKQ